MTSSSAINSSAAFADTKAHYALLDGLRGVAALLVVFYHVYEGFAFAGGAPVITFINHGYLAVDFFFILSGFVIGYAYDDRWGKGFTLSDFFKRRIIRLHPMVVMGAVLGTVTFLVQGSQQWDGTHVAISRVMLALLFAMFVIPALPGSPREVRGNGEMFPLNGPCWSLFFEYIGNIVYALCIRRLGNRALLCLTILAGSGLVWFALADVSGYGFIGVGWTADGINIIGGSLRMLFPFSAGMLLSRHFKPFHVRGAFWICSAVLLALFLVPYIPGSEPVCRNGLYEMLCVTLIFPVLVWTAASGETTDKRSTAICRFLGDLSFPLYVVHYPFMYLFYYWLIENKLYTMAETWPVVIAVYLWNVLVAVLCLRLYDIPVRRWLAKRFVKRNVIRDSAKNS